MGLGNKALRDTAIPFEALAFKSFGAFYGANNIVEMSQRSATAFTRPYAGDLTEARLTLAMNAPPGESFDLYVGIGDLDADLNVTVDYTWSDIIRRHQRLAGTATPFHCNAGGTLFIDALDLLKAIPGKNDAGYNPDGFVVLFTLATPPIDLDGFFMTKFQLLCSAQMGLAT